MIWRESYSPDMRYDLLLPELEGKNLMGESVRWTGPVIVFASSFAIRDLGIWMRLFAAHRLDVRVANLAVSALVAPSLFPPSQHAFVVTPVAPLSWATLVPGATVWAATSCGGRARQAVIGPPTEDVWEAFQSEL